MKKNNALHKLTLQGLLKILNININKLNNVLKSPYHRQYIIKNGKRRLIEIPNTELKALLQILCEYLQEIPCPKYNFYGYKGQNAYKNAAAHIGNFAFITTDISNYFPSTKTKYVKEFLKDTFELEEEVLDILLKMFTYDGHIPTGAPTSPILAFLCHKKLFDEIYSEMTAQGITFTLYADDITLSSRKGITNEMIRYIKNILLKQELKIKDSKTKHYSYKKALITGYYLHQSGKITVPDSVGESVRKKLQINSITEMSLIETQKLLGKINYINQIDKKAYARVRIKAIKHLKKLTRKERKASDDTAKQRI